MWRRGPSTVACSGSIYQIFIRFGWNIPEVSRKVIPEAHDIPRHGSGDLLEDVSGNMAPLMEMTPLDDMAAPERRTEAHRNIHKDPGLRRAQLVITSSD